MSLQNHLAPYIVSSTICTLGRSLLISLAALSPSTSGIAKSRIIVETTLGRFRDGSFGQCVVLR